MALRDKLRANAAKHLQPEEQVQAVIPATTVHPMRWIPLIVFGALPAVLAIMVVAPSRVVVVTDRRIMVCKSGRLRATPVNEIIEEGPRSTVIGEPSGLQWKCTSLGAKKLYVPKRFFGDVRAADALRPAA